MLSFSSSWWACTRNHSISCGLDIEQMIGVKTRRRSNSKAERCLYGNFGFTLTANICQRIDDYVESERGKRNWSSIRLKVPNVGTLVGQRHVGRQKTASCREQAIRMNQEKRTKPSNVKCLVISCGGERVRKANLAKSACKRNFW